MNNIEIPEKEEFDKMVRRAVHFFLKIKNDFSD